MKTMIMIGNSHIDPVWFWTWKEGMQEVKATFASALARMEEYPDFRFTCTSTAFLEWIEQIDPQMFEQIRKRAAEGRFELTGGWFVEPDCILPCGEAFVRQGLYGQRYLKEKFDRTAHTGSNVDSFGHSGMLPQILARSGMDSYVFMRPRKADPIMEWYSKDGSHVTAVSLPSEYTTWHDAMTAENMELAWNADWKTDVRACCYGVGNHGGGPTIENIESIHARKNQFPDTRLTMGTWADFFAAVKTETENKKIRLPMVCGILDLINVGCYTTDSAFKKLNRETEAKLIQADWYLSMVHQLTGTWMEETKQLKALWKLLLFNQFHDTMGGTIIKESRDDAMRQVSTAYANADRICGLAMQKLMNSIDTSRTGDKIQGFPLFFFHCGGTAFDDIVEVELNWFCKAPLCLYDPDGREVPYQIIHTDCKTRNYNIGGRRRVVFRAQIPAGGFAVYRVTEQESAVCYNPRFEIDNPSAVYLENEYVRVSIDPKTGMLRSIYDKTADFETIDGSAMLCLYHDERDAWGGLQGKTLEEVFYQKEERAELISLEKVESGQIREQIRAQFRLGSSKIEIWYALAEGEREVTVRFRVRFCEEWSALRFRFPIGTERNRVLAEDAYGVQEFAQEDGLVRPMHRFIDAVDADGKGVIIANDGKYAFSLENGILFIECARSPIYAQGYNRDWYCEKENYRFHDMYEQDFCLILHPHGESAQPAEWYRLAAKAEKMPDYMLDSRHSGSISLPDGRYSGLCCQTAHVQLADVKKAEDDKDLILRLIETDGIAGTAVLSAGRCCVSSPISPYEILTLKWNQERNEVKKVNLLEW